MLLQIIGYRKRDEIPNGLTVKKVAWRDYLNKCPGREDHKTINLLLLQKKILKSCLISFTSIRSVDEALVVFLPSDPREASNTTYSNLTEKLE